MLQNSSEAFKLDELPEKSAVQEQLDFILQSSKQEMAYALYRLMHTSQLVASPSIKQEILNQLNKLKKAQWEYLKASVIFINTSDPISRKWLLDQLTESQKKKAVHFLIAIAVRENSRRLRLTVLSHVQTILYKYTQKEVLEQVNYYAFECQKENDQRIFFDLISPANTFSKLPEALKSRIISHFLNRHSFQVLDCFGEEAHQEAVKLSTAKVHIESRLSAIAFLGCSTENESFEDLFLQLLNTEKNEVVRHQALLAIEHLSTIRNRKELFALINQERNSKNLIILLQIARKFQEINIIDDVIKLLDQWDVPEVVEALITTLISFESKRSFKVMKKAFNDGQTSVSKVLVYKGYDFKQVEIRHILDVNSSSQIDELMIHMVNLLNTERQERPILANLYNLMEIFWFSKSNDILQHSFPIYFKLTENEEQYKLVLRHLINIISTEEEPLALVGVSFFSEFSKYYYKKMLEYPNPINKRIHQHNYMQMMSLDLSTHPMIRLTLINFYNFFRNESGHEHHYKVIHRFGYFILEYLFSQLSLNKRKQKASLSYLYQNFEVFLTAPEETTIMLSEALKQFMFKYPKEFIFFIENYFTNSRIEEFRNLPKFAKTNLKEHLAFLTATALEVVMKKSILLLIKIIARIYDIENIEQLESFMGDGIIVKRKYRDFVQSRIRQCYQRNSKGQFENEAKFSSEADIQDLSEMTPFTQVLEFLE